LSGTNTPLGASHIKDEIREAIRRRLARGAKRLVAAQSVCRKCGLAIEPGVPIAGVSVLFGTEQVTKAAPLGWAATQRPNAQAQRSATKRRHDAEMKAWDPANHPAWLTEEAYRQKVQPLLAMVQTSKIASALNVTWAYASEIRKGKRLPHPRHWVNLAELVAFQV
jgi:hypothetical protein